MEESARVSQQLSWAPAGHPAAVQPQEAVLTSAIWKYWSFLGTEDITCEALEPRAFIIGRVMVYSHYI